MRRLLLISVSLAGFMAWSPTAAAHPMLDRGVSYYENADFEAAMRTFDQAARNADLSVEELLELFEMRALVHHAVGNEDAMREDLRRVAAVRPSYQLGALAPPSVVRAFNQIRANDARVELRIEEQSVGREWQISARLLRVPEQLVDHVTLNCVVGSERTAISRTSQGNETSVPVPGRGTYHRCDATARTRQGGVLFHAQLGNDLSPRSARSDLFQTPTYTSPSDGPKRKRWPWFVAAAAAVVVGGVTAGVIVSRRSGETSQPALGGATVSW